MSNRLLLRDWIAKSLYSDSGGYFNTALRVLDSPPIEFGTLRNKKEYYARLQNLYEEHKTAWLTPSEVFKPQFGRALLKWVLSGHDHSRPLVIYEMFVFPSIAPSLFIFAPEVEAVLAHWHVISSLRFALSIQKFTSRVSIPSLRFQSHCMTYRLRCSIKIDSLRKPRGKFAQFDRPSLTGVRWSIDHASS